MVAIRRIGLLAALAAMAYLFPISGAAAAVASQMQPLSQLAAATQGTSMVEQAQYRRRPRCRTTWVRRCSTRHVRRCVRSRAGRCVRWVSRPVYRCHRVPRRVCRW
jgi:hypothetical protein